MKIIDARKKEISAYEKNVKQCFGVGVGVGGGEDGVWSRRID